MTGIIVKGETPHYGVSPKVEGIDHDSCPRPDCGTVGIEPLNRLGATADGSAGSPDGMIYHHDPRTGGCGASWTRARGELAEQRAKKGLATRDLTGSAQRARYTSVPSDEYRRNYAKAFGHD